MKTLHERRRRSARETFSQCRAKYRAVYIDGMDMGSEASIRGTAFHAAAALYVQRLWDSKQTDDAELAQDCLMEARVNTPGLTHAAWLDVEALWSSWVPNFKLDLDRFYSVEGEQDAFDTKLRFDFVWVADGDTLVIEDKKTHFRMIADAALQSSYQTGFYLTAAARKIFPGFKRYVMRYHFVRFNAWSGDLELTPAELDLMEQSIRESDAAMARAEDTGIFPATGGIQCATCTLALTCDAAQSVAYSPDTMVSEIAVHERARTMLVAQLREHCEQNGNVSAHGVQWGHFPATRTTYDSRDVMKCLTEHEVDLATVPKSVWHLSGSHLKSLLGSKKKWAWLADKLRALGKTETITEFKSRRIEGLDDDAQAPEAE